MNEWMNEYMNEQMYECLTYWKKFIWNKKDCFYYLSNLSQLMRGFVKIVDIFASK